MTEVIPAIIPEYFAEIREHVERVVQYVSRVQVDIMDGQFAPTKSWPFNERDRWTFEKLVHKEITLPHAKKLIYELDMMVEKPEEYIDDWIAAGFRALIIHIESTSALQSIIEKIRGKSGRRGERGAIEIGIAFKPGTPLEALDEWIPHIDFVQHMGNDNIGYHGVSLDSFVLPKITRLREKYPELIIGIDIGVTTETAPLLVESGANRLVSGSAIFNSENIEETIKQFKALG